jgi:hypothetical protein
MHIQQSLEVMSRYRFILHQDTLRINDSWPVLIIRIRGQTLINGLFLSEVIQIESIVITARALKDRSRFIRSLGYSQTQTPG